VRRVINKQQRKGEKTTKVRRREVRSTGEEE
jgi:hypothetical protein